MRRPALRRPSLLDVAACRSLLARCRQFATSLERDSSLFRQRAHGVAYPMKRRRAGPGGRGPAAPLRRVRSYFDGDGWALGDEAPPPPLGIGDVTAGLFCTPDRVPNQFHWVKPKKRRISTSSASTAATMPEPAPAPMSLPSTTSVPAGLQ